jgi:sugar lactone lactonase YvrE
MIVETIKDHVSSLGESPVWDSRAGRLYWIDYIEKKINYFLPEKNLLASYQLEVKPGCVAPTEFGNLLVGYEHEIGLFNLETLEMHSLFAPETGKDYNHFNDGKCDASGRFWIGSMTETQDWPGGALYKVEGKETCEKVLDQVTTSNGLVWSADTKTFYYIDSMAFSVVAFDFDIAKGIISNKRIVIDSRNEIGRLDGMTIDEEGFLWIAHWNGGQVSRWNPKTGKCVTRVFLPAYNVTSCCFGGKEWDVLYVTSAKVETDTHLLGKYPQSGQTFILNPGIHGLPTNFVKGM